MRFSRFFLAGAAVAVSAAAVSGVAVPRNTPQKGDLQVIGKGICELEKALGVTDLEDFLDTTLGGAITSLDKKLGVTAVEDSLGLLDCTPELKPTKAEKGKSDIEVLSKGLCYVEKGLGVTDLLGLLDGILGGLVTDLENTLGVTYLEKKLNLSTC